MGGQIYLYVNVYRPELIIKDDFNYVARAI